MKIHHTFIVKRLIFGLPWQPQTTNKIITSFPIGSKKDNLKISSSSAVLECQHRVVYQITDLMDQDYFVNCNINMVSHHLKTYLHVEYLKNIKSSMIPFIKILLIPFIMQLHRMLINWRVGYTKRAGFVECIQHIFCSICNVDDCI